MKKVFEFFKMVDFIPQHKFFWQNSKIQSSSFIDSTYQCLKAIFIALIYMNPGCQVQWITIKHVPPVFQPSIFPAYLRNRLSYKKISLHPFISVLKTFQELKSYHCVNSIPGLYVHVSFFFSKWGMFPNS